MEKLDSDLLFRKAQALGDDIREMESIDVAKAFEWTQQLIRKKRGRQMYDSLMRYAAFLTLPLLMISLTLGYFYFSGPEAVDCYAEVTAAKGSVIRYELPDHSVAWLNAGSTLRYPIVFRKDNRSVELKGEAYFEVQADKKRPFYVNTPDGSSVYVYGTKFNVAAYEDEELIGTVLEKGKVNVITPNQETMELLRRAVAVTIGTVEWIKKRVDVYEKVAWKNGKLIFRNATLEEIFKRLSRHFNVDIEFDNRLGKEYKYRATFHKETLQQILDYLAKSAALKWRVEDAAQQADDTLAKARIIVNLY